MQGRPAGHSLRSVVQTLDDGQGHARQGAHLRGAEAVEQEASDKLHVCRCGLLDGATTGSRDGEVAPRPSSGLAILVTSPCGDIRAT